LIRREKECAPVGFSNEKRTAVPKSGKLGGGGNLLQENCGGKGGGKNWTKLKGGQKNIT